MGRREDCLEAAESYSIAGDAGGFMVNMLTVIQIDIERIAVAVERRNELVRMIDREALEQAERRAMGTEGRSG